jgi:hypothetical protein
MLDDFQDDNDGNNGGEFLDEFRQRLNSQPLENLEERKEDIHRSQHIFLGTILGVGLAGVVSYFILAPDYTDIEDTEIPVVRRQQTAVKVQPSEPGGMEILNQDKTVYDIVEKKDSGDVKVENLLPPPEEPKLPTIAAATEPEPESDKIIQDAEKILTDEENKTRTVQEAAPTVVADSVTKEEIKAVVVAEPQPEPVPAPAPVVVAENKPEPQAVAPVAQAPKKDTVAPSGSWQIQLMSSPNRSAIDKAKVDLGKKYPALKALPYEVETADLGSKGTFYRLKAGAFSEQSEAEKVCNSIKSAGGSCLVRKK